MERMREIGKKWRSRTDGSGVVHGREVVFAWMDGGEWADWLKSMYGIRNKDVAKGGDGDDALENAQVVIADHSVRAL